MSSASPLPPPAPAPLFVTHAGRSGDDDSDGAFVDSEPLETPSLLPPLRLTPLASQTRDDNDDSDEIDDEEDHELRFFDGSSSSPRSNDVVAALLCEETLAFVADELSAAEAPCVATPRLINAAASTTVVREGVRRERMTGERGYAALRDHDQQKERERTELVQMILESIANVPVAVERIHTNEKLLAALQEEMGNEHALLRRFFSVDGPSSGASELDAHASGYTAHTGDAAFSYSSGTRSADDDEDSESESESESESDESSGFGSDYEHDLAEAVHQLCMSDDTIEAMEKQMSVPIAIGSGADAFDAASTSGSPQSSINFGASPGNNSQDGEPVSALWPRQPHQFAFTQEEEANARGEDEVYSEIIGSMCEDESFRGEEEEEEDEGDEAAGDDDDDDDDAYDATAKVFDMDEDDSAMDAHISGYRARQPFASGATGVTAGFRERARGSDAVDREQVGDEHDDDDDDESDDEYEREYEVVELRIIREKNKTGFEPSRDWRPRVGSVIAGRYKVELAIGEAVFSRTYKCIDTTTQTTVCLKIIKNSKEYFDQGVDEVRLLQYIARHCNVDDKHLVRLLDFFYFHEHLIIVTELLRDNLYEFSKLLLARGVINYFSMARLKKISIEVLEALQALHALGIVHCDLKPENILISSFNECRVKVIDFGSACFVTDELTSYVQSRSYRAPEVILGLAYDQKIDVWSFGCVLAELFTGEVLFKNESEQTLLARIIAAIGPVPSNLLEEREDLGEQFRENELFAVDARGDGVLLDPLHLPSLEQVVQTGDRLFLDFLRGLLRIDPARRLSATQALLHPWLASGVFSAATLRT